MSLLSRRPHRLGPNKVPVYYAGGEGIDRFRGVAGALGAGGSEDWVGSVTAFPPHILPPGADPDTGVSRLPDGTSLRDAVSRDPVGWLGPALAQEYGEPALLVKLLDAGERLPVHCHPSRAFARAKLDSPFGKNEGWIVLDTAADAAMWLGFRRDVGRDEMRRWIEAQDVETMLSTMNPVRVHPGDVLYVPAGLPHAFGPGVMIVELQEPTSFSILAEYRRFGLTLAQATLGLSLDDALDCFDRTAYDEARLLDLRPQPYLVEETDGGRIWQLFGTEAAPYFQAYRIEARGRVSLNPVGGFCILIVERGTGVLTSGMAEDSLMAGQTWVIPHDAGLMEVRGDAEVIVCVPPNPSA